MIYASSQSFFLKIVTHKQYIYLYSLSFVSIILSISFSRFPPFIILFIFLQTSLFQFFLSSLNLLLLHQIISHVSVGFFTNTLLAFTPFLPFLQSSLCLPISPCSVHVQPMTSPRRSSRNHASSVSLDAQIAFGTGTLPGITVEMEIQSRIERKKEKYW